MHLTNTINNPVIPGFYSDPSLCRDGDDYYLVCSSFEYYPGVPLFHSKDLVNWTQIANCLNTDEQLPLKTAITSDGIYAPTLRKHKDTFYLITSNRCSTKGNHFFVTTNDITGKWSNPTWVTDINGEVPQGVDPSLFFDSDGKVYFNCVAWDNKGQGIGQAEIDIQTGQLLTPLQIVWYGTGGTFPEGPHTYKIGAFYYLMIAEGGTEFGHKVTLARSTQINGPYNSCPHNPILTQIYQQAQSSPIQGVGHGDLFEAHDHTWWMVVHGFRPSIGKLHHLGRETLLIPIIWDNDGWPIANQKGWIDESIQLQGEFCNTVQTNDFHTKDSFSSNELPFYWNFLRNPIKSNYIYPNNGQGISLLGSSTSINQISNPTWIGRRQQHFSCSVNTTLFYCPLEGEEAGITVFQTNEHHYDIVITKRRNQTICFLRKVIGDLIVEEPYVILSEEKSQLSIKANREQYTFLIVNGEKTYLLGTGRTQLISTEAMQYQNFTGTFFAMYAFSQEDQVTPANFAFFEYIPSVS